MTQRFDPQRFRAAVTCLAMYRAKKGVQTQIRANGRRISDFTCKQIGLLAQDYFATHMEELITMATADVATFPEFARHRCAELLQNVRKNNEPISTTSAVQMSGAK